MPNACWIVTVGLDTPPYTESSLAPLIVPITKDSFAKIDSDDDDDNELHNDEDKDEMLQMTDALAKIAV